MNQFESFEIHELSAALCKAQAEMPIAEKSSSNPFFKSKYADLQVIVESSRPCLTKHGLSVTQQIITIENEMYLLSKLRHSSGQWIASQAKINPIKNDIQSVSSYITYLKRICYSSLVGVVTGELDDDGEMAVAPTRNFTPIIEYVDSDQVSILEEELNGYPETAKSVYEGMEKLYKTRSFDKLARSQFHATLSRIKELKSVEDRKR